jgi:hypothetical protein
MNAMMPVPDSAASSAGNTDAPEIARIHALVEQLRANGQRTAAEVLEELRRAFPDSPLAVRVRALEALRGR